VGVPVATGFISNPRLSPDGGRLLYQRVQDVSQSGAEIYVVDVARATDTRLTFTGGTATTPAWSPDGRRFGYITQVGNQDSRLHIGSADGLGAPDSIALSSSSVALWQWSSSGSRLVCFTLTGAPFAVPAEGTQQVPRSLADSTLTMFHPSLSPDGRWMVGVMGALPNVQVFVQSVEGAPGRWQISSAPGVFPRWTRGGRELVYEGVDGKMMSVEIDTQGTFRAGTPKLLFALPMRSFAFDENSWDVSADGGHFAFIAAPRAATSGSIEVATDVHALVSRK
jgi:Tol biopolymer transport system component